MVGDGGTCAVEPSEPQLDPVGDAGTSSDGRPGREVGTSNPCSDGERECESGNGQLDISGELASSGDVVVRRGVEKSVVTWMEGISSPPPSLCRSS